MFWYAIGIVIIASAIGKLSSNEYWGYLFLGVAIVFGVGVKAFLDYLEPGRRADRTRWET